MVDALQKWPRPIPLAWHHQTDAASIFGAIDPASVHEVNGEVVAKGHVDLESDVGREAWRSFKARTLGFSFGYLVPEGGSTPRPGGGRHITAIDVFEVTATATPMNNDTRVLSTKALDPDLKAFGREFGDLIARAMSHDPDPTGTLRTKAQRAAREHAPIRIATFDA